MSTIGETIGTQEYFTLLQEHPVKLTPTLAELGPLIRLQLLFTMCNEPSYGIQKNFYSWGCEVFKNLSLIGDLTLLHEVDLGEHGK